MIKKILLVLCCFLASGMSSAQIDCTTFPDSPACASVAYSATVVFDAPTQREDGSALSPSEIDHYELYVVGDGGFGQVYDVQTDATEVSVGVLPADNYTFSMITVDTDGQSSNFSDYVTTTVGDINRPTAPVNLRVNINLSININSGP